jgi:Flp pilus assembly protein TadB
VHRFPGWIASGIWFYLTLCAFLLGGEILGLVALWMLGFFWTPPPLFILFALTLPGLALWVAYLRRRRRTIRDRA